MTERITPRQLTEAHGLADWRILRGGGWACAHFRTPSFSVGLALVRAVGDAATTANRHPDVDLRPEGVTVRLRADEPEGFRTRDLDLARTISAAARALDARADPGAVQHVLLAVEAHATPEVRPFWRAVLGYDELGEDGLLDPRRRGPSWRFQAAEGEAPGGTDGGDDPRPHRARMQVELSLPNDQVEARIAAAVAAGGRVVGDVQGPARWTLADAEGHEIDLVVWTAS